MRDFLKHRDFVRAFVLSLFVGGFLAACVPNTTGPTPTNTTVNTNVNVNVGNPGASPSPGTPGTVAAVGIGKVAETPIAPGTQCSGRGDAIKVGCTAFLTCSPKDSTGRELFEGIPQAPEFFNVISGNEYVSVAPHGSNAYNLDVSGVRATPTAPAPVFVLLQCKVGNVTSPAFPLSIVP